MVGRGRPRKRAPPPPSKSTFFNFDENNAVYLKETDVLKPVPPRVHSDDWPCFLLNEATVYHPNGSIANLLHVSLDGPFIVRGLLIVEKDRQQFLINRPGQTRWAWIQIQNSFSFSIGQKNDDDLQLPVVWASGQAGWFEIVPSEKYRSMCDTIFHGINLHYSILDQYEEALARLHRKKKNRDKSLQHVELPLEEVLFQYAVTVGDAITLREAWQRCADQAAFLLSHLPKELAFHRWLTQQHPDIAKKVALSEQQDRSTTKIAPESIHPALQAMSDSFEIPDRTSKQHATTTTTTGGTPTQSAQRSMRSSEAARSESVDIRSDGQRSDRQQSSDDRATRSKRVSPTGVQPTKPDIEMPDASARMPSSSRAPDDSRGLPVLLDTLEEIRESILREMRGGKNKKHPDQLSPSSLQYKVYLACRIKTRWGAPELCRYFAQDLVRELGPHWHQSEFYQWARENAGSKAPFEHSSEEECLGLVRRNSKKPKATTEAITEATTEASGSFKQRVKQLGGNHWETPPEPAGKQPPRKRGRPSGKSASLRPSLGSKKRSREDEGDDEDGSEMDIDEIDPSKKTAKKSKYFSDDNGDEDDVDDAGASSAAEDDDDDDDDEQGGAATDSGSGSRLVLRAEKLPSTTPKGPNGTWTCEEPGCGHVVRAADEKDGQNLIRAHYEEHEQEARDESEAAALKRVNLAKQEAGRNMPIDHLLEKIRKMGDKAQHRDERRLNGQTPPQPIKRTLLV